MQTWLVTPIAAHHPRGGYNTVCVWCDGSIGFAAPVHAWGSQTLVHNDTYLLCQCRQVEVSELASLAHAPRQKGLQWMPLCTGGCQSHRCCSCSSDQGQEFWLSFFATSLLDHTAKKKDFYHLKLDSHWLHLDCLIQIDNLACPWLLVRWWNSLWPLDCFMTPGFSCDQVCGSDSPCR